MEKYLFTDGMNGVMELQSQEDLQTHIDSVFQSDKIRIWIFSSNEWISYVAFCKRYPSVTKKDIILGTVNAAEISGRAARGKHWLKKFLFAATVIAGAILIFNFTKIKWTKAPPINITAARPANVPVMDIDSLIMVIEGGRGILLDRSTRTNLRLRNTWPDRIELQLNSEREASSSGSRFYNVDVSIDNSTGFNLDEAIVKLSIWKNGKVNTTDTLWFNNIRYDKLATRQLKDSYRGDSITVSFESIKAKAFNFCYSADVKNNSGNYNDRWFCRE